MSPREWLFGNSQRTGEVAVEVTGAFPGCRSLLPSWATEVPGFLRAPRPLRHSAPGQRCIPGPRHPRGWHRPPGLFWFGSCGEGQKDHTLRNPAGGPGPTVAPPPSSAPDTSGPGPMLMSCPLNLGLQRLFSCLLWGSPWKATSCCHSPPPLPLQAPAQVRK